MPQSTDMSAEHPQTFGQRVQKHRTRRGITRTVLAGLVGRSPEWVKAIENDRISMPRLPRLLRLAEALGIDDIAELTGDERIARSRYAKRSHESLDTVRTSLVSSPVTSGPDEPVDLSAFAARVAAAWRAWHSSREERTAVAPLLPGLLVDGRRALRGLDGTERREMARLMTQVYHLTQLFCTFQPAPELVYMASDRAMLSAEDADDPAAMAGAAWYLNHVWRDAGEAADARVEIALRIADMLRCESSREHRALYSLMHLAAALSYAKTGREGEAWHHHDKAGRAARDTDGYTHPWLMVGTGMVEHYAVTIHLDLQQPARALDMAKKIDPSALPSRTRKSRYLVEIARAHHQLGNDDAAVYQMSKAREVSLDTFGFSLFAKSMVSDMLPRASASSADDVRDLARTLNLTV
ncbi:helix-turn-helix domain-containing protein [Streptomyces gobiensis]|uniref:helix-turn-helix domain-containing protein n=1 Tax=Streptomyces gobiensis TaxID=2875706 RepID=UPI001E49626F|nr:helix-turn-helix transcriptional regulator [Streptomyces gobiensis]UGY92630.1 helix-turn-helix domain-containing protein [Streptomyces gobiensis]